MLRWLSTDRTLVTGGVTGTFSWLVANHNLATVDLRSIPTWQVLRSHTHGFTDVLHEAVMLQAPMPEAFEALYSGGSAATVQSTRWINLEYLFADLLTAIVSAAAVFGLLVGA